ncbi:MAG TPA: Rne/Rng family ribonuclease, partial [Alphaproteobacteria bacterium]|nr:Rne/Rng family ribonuclease [Alphaproteobacteria bacterium]
MVKRMLVDATHPEETRVVILNGTRLEEFDFETSTKKQLKGNIYLAKVTRVEPSLQAAFVEFGGNRHGFLAFSEIHPDYYQIPVADRMALLAEQEHDLKQTAEVEDAAAEAAAVEPAADLPPEQPWQPETLTPETPTSDTLAAEPAHPDEGAEAVHAPDALSDAPSADPGFAADAQLHGERQPFDTDPYPPHDAPPAEGDAPAQAETADAALAPSEPPDLAAPTGEAPAARAPTHYEEVGGDDQEDTQEAMAARRKARSHRHRYKIQEVIKRRQILLVQVVKEERGTKGAALTTYLSLAGRYCVLMPNTSRGGGVSRRIPSAGDRKRLKECMDEMEVPEGMAVILRTAALERSKAEIKRDFEYLLRQWDNVRELTLQSVAPALVYEEASLIKRAIRDLYLKDIDEVLVEGDDGYRMAKEFMRVLMPSHAKKVQQYSDPEIPLYHRYQVEPQLDAMHSPTVNLKSGGYIVINPTEALVAIDVNSGRATRERNIEETAYKTNLEAAEEVARQLRLRDLGGLIVIDFIDMEDQRNVHTVEKRLKEAMKADRARIQIGRISPFGLLELSRQRLRPSLLEASAERCPYCAGSGMIRSTESTALHVLRSVEEEGIRHRTAEVALTLPPTVALYILNQKRARLNEIEQRYHFTVRVTIDDALIPPAFKLERLRARELPPPGAERPAPIAAGAVEIPTPAEIEEAIEAIAEPVEVEEETVVDNVETVGGDSDRGEDGHGRRRRRRGRRGGRDERGERGERAPREDRGPREERADRGPREDRGPRDERGDGPRDERGDGQREQRQHQPRERFGLTPAEVGAMLDGRPVSSLDEEDEGLQPGNGEPTGNREPAEGHGPEGHGAEELGPDGQPRRRRRRGRRGGRRRRRHWEEGQEGQEGHGAPAGEGEQPPF